MDTGSAVAVTPYAGVTFKRPKIQDGAGMWRLARRSGTLDLNSSYSYLLWCRDFTETSLVAKGPDGELCGFVTGYIRPELPNTLVVWQIAVDTELRGRGVAAAMLDTLVSRTGSAGASHLEATITPGNTASARLFVSFAGRHEAPVTREVLFDTVVFPDAHDTELLYRIGPFTPTLARR